MERKPLIYEFDGIRVEAAEAQAFRDGRRLAVEPKAFRVLVYLLERRGQLVRKEELRAAVWQETFVTENAVARAIAVLRRTLGDNKEEPKYIQTVPTLGYRFIAEVNVRESDAAIPLPIARPSAAWRLPAALGFAVSLALAAVWWRTTPPVESAFQNIQVTSSPGLDIYPAFSPDGGSLAYSSDESGSFEIYVKRFRSADQPRRITFDGARNLQASWSPDGFTIAYYSQASGGLWLIPAAGGAGRRLTTFGSNPKWSPDGRQIVFQSGGIRDLSQMASVSVASSNLWIVGVSDGTIRPLTRVNQPPGAHNSPAWSPDGKNVVFVVNSVESNPDLWSIAVANQSLMHLPECGATFDPVFEPSGRSLLVASTRSFGVWRLPATWLARLLESPQRLSAALPGTTMDRYLAVSRDGRHIAFSRVSTSSNLYSLRLDASPGSAQPQPLTHDTQRRKTLPSVSPDGRSVLFLVSSSEPSAGTWIADLDGGNARPVAPQCGDPQWLDPDDFACSTDKGGAQVWRVHIATGEREPIGRIPGDAGFIKVNRDGATAAYMNTGSGAPNVWLASLPRGEIRQVTFDAESAGFPAWSPDGHELALEVKRGDSANVYTLRPGGQLVPVTHDSGQNWPYSWSPDGKRIAFAAMRGGVWNVWWAARDGSEERQLTHHSGERHYVRYPAWSPTGNAIVYEYGETRGNIWVMERR